MARNYARLLKKPKDQTFYRNVIFWLTILGFGHSTWWGYKKPHKFVTFLYYFFPPFVPLSVVSEIFYVIANRNDLTFEVVGVILAIFPVTCIIFINTLSSHFKTYRKLMKEFMGKIHLYNYKNQAGVNDEALIQIERITRYISCFLIVCIMIDWFSWVFIPIVYNVKNIEKIRNKTKTLNVFIYYWTPFDYKYNVRNWIYLHTVEAVLALAGCSMVSVFNSVAYMFIYHLIGHIKSLKEKVKVKLEDVSNDQEVSRNLKEIIQYHIFIKTMFKDIQMAFGLNVTATYMHNLIGDSLLLYQVMFGEQGSFATYGLMFLLYMGGLILISFILEEIKIQSDDLSVILYNVPWEDMSVRNQKTFLILFGHVQRPLEFTAAGGLRAGVKPMISIVKSTFSYYVMLKTSVK